MSLDLNNLKNSSKEELVALAKALDALEEKQKYQKLATYFPKTGPLNRYAYKKHMKFFEAGKDHRFRLFVGANRSGKSLSGGWEAALHMVGTYDEVDWPGHRFKKIKTVWILCESGALWRDSLQKLLLGDPGEETGTGLIPLAEKNNGIGIVKYSALPGTPGAIGSFIIKHKKGHNVSVVVKTYEMAREQLQAAKVDLMVFDEEPPEHLYAECMLRLMGAGKEPGRSMMLYTPIKGYTQTTMKYMVNGTFPDNGLIPGEPEKHVTVVGWDDVPHLTKEDKDAMMLEIPARERDCRTRGIPTMGSGKIYPVDEQFVFVDPIKIPDYWPRAYGLDFAGPNGYTAALWVAEDPVTRIRYIYSEYKRTGVTDDQHVSAILAKGKWIEGACDPSGGGARDNGQLRRLYYKELGLQLTLGNNAFLTGISNIYNKLEAGQYKIFNTCEMIKKEMRLYRYDNRDPNKAAPNQDDHLMDTWRYVESRFDVIAKSYEDEFFSENRNDRPFKRDDVTGY